MSIADSIRRTSFLFRMGADWLETDLVRGGYATEGAQSTVDLLLAEETLTKLAGQARDLRLRLLANAPQPAVHLQAAE